MVVPAGVVPVKDDESCPIEEREEPAEAEEATEVTPAVLLSGTTTVPPAEVSVDRGTVVSPSVVPAVVASVVDSLLPAAVVAGEV